MRHLDDCLGIASEFFHDARDRAEAKPVIQAAQILCSETQPGDEHRLRQSIEGGVTPKPRRKEFVRRFETVLRNVYIDRITAYTDEQVSFTKEVPLSENTAEVKSTVEGKSGRVEIDYRVIKDDGGWRVYDVVIDGVSLINNYRSQFREILANNPPEKLLEVLAEKSGKK